MIKLNRLGPSPICINTIFLALLLTAAFHPLICFGSSQVGPYSGQVVDSMTGKPIVGASVLIAWEKVELIDDESKLIIQEKIKQIDDEFKRVIREKFGRMDDVAELDLREMDKLITSGYSLIPREILSLLINPCSTADAVVLFTDGKGKYEQPLTQLPIGPLERLIFAKLVIYQPGYRLFKIGRSYNMPQWPGAPEREKEFEETAYQVRLDRVPPVFDHESHFETIASTVNAIDEKFRPIPSRLLLRRAEWEQSVKGQ